MVFDQDLRPKPSTPTSPFWGGYLVEFKLIERARYQALGGDLWAIRRQAEAVGDAAQSRRFRIEISKYEYVEGKAETELDDYLCYVYTLPMIAAEKLRAICQQMAGYEPVKHPRPCARDFYDIAAIVQAASLDFADLEFQDLVRHMFAAKRVPLGYLGRLGTVRAFHEQDWAAVRGSIADRQHEFGDYYDFVVKEVVKLQPLWEE